MTAPAPISQPVQKVIRASGKKAGLACAAAVVRRVEGVMDGASDQTAWARARTGRAAMHKLARAAKVLSLLVIVVFLLGSKSASAPMTK
jgi:hypothetical protein